ncbi:hypothetical protein [Occallatibacter riparius]|uniref:Uncharacterized protein n=1 Tax=Occallatibacter riparius TaxID=1002689 RepID=A0A9J7BKG0_9BACT|nr:hypothetical protein [Occallatibacter riparius]UWZ83364.1 hypothetical protein MOP44_22700 [Occallatibacter riparius]
MKSIIACLSILASILIISVPASSQSAPAGLEVAPGLRVNGDAIVWVLESPDSTPALHPLTRNTATITDPAKLPPASPGKTRDGAILRGTRATVRIHAGQAIFYVAYSKGEDEENHKPPPSAPLIFSLVRLRPAANKRVVAWYNNPGPHQKPTLQETVIEATATPSDDDSWLKITPAKPLTPGEYAIVQRIPEYNHLSNWIFDFGVD